MTYYLAKHKNLLSKVPNLTIYTIHKRENADTPAFDDVESKVDRISRIGFWLRLCKHRLAQSTYEITYVKYFTQKVFRRRWAQDEAELFSRGDEEVSLDGFSMTKTGKLRVDDQDIEELLSKQNQVKLVDGRVYTCSRFGDRAAHVELMESKNIKSLRADAFVLCSSVWLMAQMNELRVKLPIMRGPTELVQRTNKDLNWRLMALNGPVSTLTPDRLPLMGNIQALTNLYFFTGFSSATLALRVQAAKQFANYFVDGETSTIQEQWDPRRFDTKFKKSS